MKSRMDSSFNGVKSFNSILVRHRACFLRTVKDRVRGEVTNSKKFLKNASGLVRYPQANA
jgi:hypothetical protein